MTFIAAAGVAAVVLFFFTRAIDPDRARSGGPVGNRAVDAYSVPARFGRPVATGTLNMINYGEETAVIEKIDAVSPPAGIAVKAVRVAGHDRGMVPAIEGWPSSKFKDTYPVAGYRLEPRSSPAGLYGAGVVFSLNPKKPGRYAFRGFDVTYRVDGKRYRSRIKSSWILCSNTGPWKSWKPCRLRERPPGVVVVGSRP